MKLRQTMILMSFGLVPAVSMADVTANIGVMSDYIYRGIFQEDSAASAGIDYEHESGFYVGTWGASVGDGIEVDLYTGFGQDAGPVSWSVGVTGYYYPDDFDDTYEEVNLGLGWAGFALDGAVGEFEPVLSTSPSQDYTFLSLTYTFDAGAYLKYGEFGDQFSGDYLEAGIGFEYMGLDLSLALIQTDNLSVSERDPSAEYSLTFGLSYSFGLGQ